MMPAVGRRQAICGGDTLDEVEIGRRLQKRREQLELKQQDVATRTGVSLSHISRIERGKSGGLKMEDLRKLADALDTNISWVLDGDDPSLTDAIEAFAPNSDLTRNFADIANFYRSAEDWERRHIERMLGDIADYFRQRDPHVDRLHIAVDRKDGHAAPHDDGVSTTAANGDAALTMNSTH
jgi:transcriptional regulator with XRE-family HTH domain